ncbi:TetR family transcriptional regulator [Streptomyces sp. NTH33]|uniref:TetR family transcriptional regulator n=1 Tax=Streptomyces sp. NTH33 TaxID=1735453 RepID=UPI000DA860B8|nr:TetR family transcriptional regulator [Streptomyces sp. NTH33]PZG99639.1 TetR family transcriptional regulator [Streptomyces sp. NTH33]
MESTVGLRERKKAATRRAVHEAALRLTVEHGFDAVTVEAVADAAGISRRTFSNYFATKEDAVLWGDECYLNELVAAFRARPAEETAWTALRTAVLDRLPQSGAQEWETLVRTRLALRHPALLARQLAKYAALEAELTEAITDRRHTSDADTALDAGVMASAFLVALRITMRRWIDSDLTHDPRELVVDTMNRMARPFV